MKSAIARRLTTLEASHGKGGNEPTLFVSVIPDVEASQDDGRRAVLGVASQALGLRVSIRPSESMEALQVRAAALLPSCRVWMVACAHRQFSREVFERCTEAG